MNTKNQITNPGFTYDSSGDLTSDGVYNYTWDAEGRLASANGVTYTYDGDGRRVEKSSGTIYWYDDKGNVIEETDLSGNLMNHYFYAAGMRVWREDAAGNVYTYFSDPLGSVRYVVGPAGTESESDWYPFGGERVISDTLTSANHYKFTGMERDTETGLDHTLFRQFTSVYGRWYSPDRMIGNVLNPQTWNRYAYVTNNPATMTDPFGLSGNCGTAYAGCPTNVPDANQTAQAEIANYQASVNTSQENLTPESPDMASGEQAVTEEAGQAFMNNCTNCDKSSTYAVDGTTYTYQTADVSAKLTAGTNNATIATGDTQTGKWVAVQNAFDEQFQGVDQMVSGFMGVEEFGDRYVIGGGMIVSGGGLVYGGVLGIVGSIVGAPETAGLSLAGLVPSAAVTVAGGAMLGEGVYYDLTGHLYFPGQ